MQLKVHIRWAVYLGRTEPGPNAKNNCLFSRRLIFGSFLVFWSAFQPFTLFMLGICFVTGTLNTNYFGTTFDGVPGSFDSDQIECICNQNRSRFKVPSKRLSNEVQVPCLTEILFSASTNCASTVSLALTRLPWPPSHLSEGYVSCTRICCQGLN